MADTENYYELLGVSSEEALEAIQAVVARKSRELRKLEGNKKKYEEFAALKDIVYAVGPIFKSAEARAAYDAKLKVAFQARTENLPIADEDYYALLGLPHVATEDQIHEALNGLSTKEGMAERVSLIRAVLLDEDKRKEYNALYAAKKAFEKERETRPPMPLQVGERAVHSLEELETAVDAAPSTALSQFQDDEIAAWVEWSLGKRHLAQTIRSITADSLASDTPYLELDQMLRLSNSSRPLILYEQGGSPGGNSPVLKTPRDLLATAESHYPLTVKRLDYILTWLEQSGHATLVDALYAVQPSSSPSGNPVQTQGNGAAAGTEPSPNVQLERLLFIIDSKLPSPEMMLEGIVENQLDFGEIGVYGLSDPKKEIVISHQGRGYLYGTVSSNQPWITVDPPAFEGKRTTVTISVNRNKLESGKDNVGSLEVKAVDGRVPTVSTEVAVNRKTIGGTLKGLFGRKK